MKQLVLHDDYCRERLVLPVLLGVAAIGMTAVVLFVTGFQARSVLLIVPPLVAGLLVIGVMSLVDVRARVELLRRLKESGIPTQAVFVDTEWSKDSESAWGESVWTYASGGRNFQVRAAEHRSVKVRTEARALVDPDRPERAVLVMPNGMTRGGYRPLGGWDVRRVVLVALLAATWGLWVVAIGVALAS
jgi:hypothetical protein